MKILKEFTGKFLKFENEKAAIYIPTAPITNKALLEIDVENSDQDVINKLKNNLRKDYNVEVIKFFSKKEINEVTCKHIKKTVKYIKECMDDCWDCAEDDFEIDIDLELSNNSLLKISITDGELECSSNFILPHNIDNSININKLFNNDSTGFKYIRNMLAIIDTDTIRVLKKYGLIDDADVEILYGYTSVIYWIKGVIDVLYKKNREENQF